MQVKTQKSALSETLKAEVNKVMAKNSAKKGKPAKTKSQVTESGRVAKKVTKTVSKTQPPKGSRLQKVEKKAPKQKIIRDSFSMPEDEYKLIAVLKQKCFAANVAIKKNELLAAGLKALSKMSQQSLNKFLSR